MNTQELIKFLRNMQGEMVSEAELYCAEPWYGSGNMVFTEPEDYAIEEAIKALEEQEKHRWIPVSERLPEEHDSMFAKFKGTDKWNNAMFEKISDDVNVTVEFENGTRKTMTMHTTDGKWKEDFSIVKKKIIAWTLLLFCGCAAQTEYNNAVEYQGGNFGNGYFTSIKEWNDRYTDYYVVYANDTKVMYLVCNNYTYSGHYVKSITPLYNADGTLQIYEGE